MSALGWAVIGLLAGCILFAAGMATAACIASSKRTHATRTAAPGASAPGAAPTDWLDQTTTWQAEL